MRETREANTARQRRLRLGYYVKGLNAQGKPRTLPSRFTGSLPYTPPANVSETERAWWEFRATIPIQEPDE